MADAEPGIVRPALAEGNAADDDELTEDDVGAVGEMDATTTSAKMA